MKRWGWMAVMVLAASTAAAGQFGLEAGMSLEQLKKVAPLKQVSPYTYSAGKLPDGHAAFDDYRLIVTPHQGLCKVVAFTPAISTSAYGDDLKSKFDTLYEALAEKYGKNKKFDFLRSGSIWNEPRDWMMGLAKGDRTLVAFWDREEGSTLPGTLSAIKLEANALSSDVGMISLGYEFTNFSECRDWIKGQQNSSL